MYRAGQKPGEGTYYCEECYHKIEVDDSAKELPKCPVCGAVTFTKDEAPAKR